jgi:hypothetical protein
LEGVKAALGVEEDAAELNAIRAADLRVVPSNRARRKRDSVHVEQIVARAVGPADDLVTVREPHGF